LVGLFACQLNSTCMSSTFDL